MRNDFVLLAGLAVAAMSACTENEEALKTSSESVISFQPLAAVQTKAEPVKEYVEKTGDFRVYAWYQKTEISPSFDPSKTYTSYMSNVLCKYESGNFDEGDGENTWMPESTYYWPKNGKLTFSAYYPASATVHVDPTIGITATGYTVENASSQVDLMYSNRVFDRVSTTQTDDNKKYDGVDIVFNHALAAADFNVKVVDGANYASDAIKVYNIDIIDALSTGDFTEGYTTGKKDETPKAKWACKDGTEKNYSVFSYNDNGSSVILPTTTAIQAGSTCILLPQTFSDNIKIVVKYGIKYKAASNDQWLMQTAEFPLKGTKNSDDDSEITGWEMGKWYHYTFTFTLDQIYFAPSVSDWKDVTVKDFEVK